MHTSVPVQEVPVKGFFERVRGFWGSLFGQKSVTIRIGRTDISEFDNPIAANNKLQRILSEDRTTIEFIKGLQKKGLQKKEDIWPDQPLINKILLNQDKLRKQLAKAKAEIQRDNKNYEEKERIKGLGQEYKALLEEEISS